MVKLGEADLQEICRLIGVEVNRHLEPAVAAHKKRLADARERKRKAAEVVERERYQKLEASNRREAANRAAAACYKAREQGRQLSFRDAFAQELAAAKRNPTRYQRRANPKNDRSQIATRAAFETLERRANGEKADFVEVFDELMAR